MYDDAWHTCFENRGESPSVGKMIYIQSRDFQTVFHRFSEGFRMLLARGKRDEQEGHQLEDLIYILASLIFFEERCALLEMYENPCSRICGDSSEVM